MTSRRSPPFAPCRLRKYAKRPGPRLPSGRRLDCRFEGHTLELGARFTCPFQIVQEFQEHDPDKNRYAVKISVDPLVLAHDVSRGLYDASELLCRRLRLCSFLLFSDCHSSHILPL